MAALALSAIRKLSFSTKEHQNLILNPNRLSSQHGVQRLADEPQWHRSISPAVSGMRIRDTSLAMGCWARLGSRKLLHRKGSCIRPKSDLADEARLGVGKSQASPLNRHALALGLLPNPSVRPVFKFVGQDDTVFYQAGHHEHSALFRHTQHNAQQAPGISK